MRYFSRYKRKFIGDKVLEDEKLALHAWAMNSVWETNFVKSLTGFYEYMGCRGEVEISSDYPIQSWVETDLMENIISEVQNSEMISVTVSPYEIKTILVRF